jgi:hypothetical protein
VNANQGAGGGAGYFNGSAYQPSSTGGSGVVVVRYLK